METQHLYKEAKHIIESKLVDYDSKEGLIGDILTHGCESGMIPELIYYDDTKAFFNRHKTEINGLLADAMSEFGVDSPSQIFGNWDDNDPLALNDNNQNLLSWWAFETMARDYANNHGIEY